MANTWTAFLRKPSTFIYLVEIGLVGAVLGLEADVYPWVFQIGGLHHMLLVHAAGGVVATLSSVSFFARVVGTPIPALVEAAFGLVGGALLIGAGSVLLAAWDQRAEAAIHDQVMPGIHAPQYLNSDKMAAAGFLALTAAIPSLGRVLVPILCR